MTDLHTAAKLALEALEMYLNIDTMDEIYLLEMDLAPKAVTALREALEQPARTLEELYALSREVSAEQPAQTDWEAVAADQAMTIALLKAEQPAQQEPVAWMYWQSCLNDDGTQTAPWVQRCSKFKPPESVINKKITPLYTTPPAAPVQELEKAAAMALDAIAASGDFLFNWHDCEPNNEHEMAGYSEALELNEKAFNALRKCLLTPSAQPTDCDCKAGMWCCKESCPRTTPPAAPAQDVVPEGVIAAIRNEGLTLVKDLQGYRLMRLGKVEAQAAPPAAKRQWVGLMDEEAHEAIGLAGVELLELAKMWSDNKIHVYQFDNEARKIIKAVLSRAIEAKLKEKNT